MHVFSLCCSCPRLEFHHPLLGASGYEPHAPWLHPLMTITLGGSRHGTGSVIIRCHGSVRPHPRPALILREGPSVHCSRTDAG